MRDNFVCNSNQLKKLKPIDNSYTNLFSSLGMTGHTAYIGLLKHGELKTGQTVLVSSAGGSVGSTALVKLQKILVAKLLLAQDLMKKLTG